MGGARRGQHADEQRIYAFFAGIFKTRGRKGQLYYIIADLYTQVTRKFRRFRHKKSAVTRLHFAKNERKTAFLAGVAGFEPTNDGVRGINQNNDHKI